MSLVKLALMTGMFRRTCTDGSKLMGIFCRNTSSGPSLRRLHSMPRGCSTLGYALENGVHAGKPGLRAEQAKHLPCLHPNHSPPMQTSASHTQDDAHLTMPSR